MHSKKPFVYGLIGAFGLVAIYFGILGFANSFTHAVQVFDKLWYWIILLALGFGTQLGLYIYIRQALKEKVKGVTAEVATAGGISTGSMIACCAHHLTDVLPLLGLTAAAMFLVRFQIPFILLGVFSNLVGITIMFNLIQKHHLQPEGKFFQSLFRIRMITLRNATLVVGVVIVASSFLVAGSKKPAAMNAQKQQSAPIDLSAETNTQNYVAVEVQPVQFTPYAPSTFKIALNTHQGSLAYDLTKIATLVCDKGTELKPIRWEGTPPGGHHRFGTLVFPKFDHNISRMTLTIRGIYNVPEREFKWDL